MEKEPTRVLVIESGAAEAAAIAGRLEEGRGFAAVVAPRLSTALGLLERRDFDAALLDLDPPHAAGLDGLRRVRALRPALPVVALAGPRDEALAEEAAELGAFDALVKGGEGERRLERVLRRAAELKRLADALRAEARETRRVAEVKDHFLSRATHDLRNTLSTLTAAVFCLQDGRSGPMTAAQARLLDMIARNVDREVRIAEGMADLARFRAGRLKVRYGPVDLRALAERAAEESSFSGRPIRPEVRAPEGLPRLEGDAELIAQVLRALVDNAQRFARRRIAVEAAADGAERVRVSVVDDGPGVPAARLAELFSASQPADRRPGGLGLTLCKEIVEGHRGRIWAESAPGAGARFCFVLPVRRPEPGLADDRAPAAAAAPFTGPS